MKIINAAKISCIPNSRDEFNVYSYKAKAEDLADFRQDGYFNPACYFMKSGDVLRIFKYDEDDSLVAYLEFLATKVSTKEKSVTGEFINEILFNEKVVNKSRSAKSLEEIIKKQVVELLGSTNLKSVVTKVVKDFALKASVEQLEDNA